MPHLLPPSLLFFFFNYTATTEIYTLALHDALPIYRIAADGDDRLSRSRHALEGRRHDRSEEHSLNSSHTVISYAVFCLKNKKRNDYTTFYKKKNKKITQQNKNQHSH